MKGAFRGHLSTYFLLLILFHNIYFTTAQSSLIWPVNEQQQLSFDLSCNTKEYPNGETQKSTAKIFFTIEKINDAEITYDYYMEMGRSNEGICLSQRQNWNDYKNTHSVYGPASNLLWINYVYDSVSFLNITRVWQVDIERWQNTSQQYSQTYGGDKTKFTSSLTNTSYEVRLTWITSDNKQNEFNKKVEFTSKGVLHYYREIQDIYSEGRMEIEVKGPDYVDPMIFVGLVLGGVVILLALFYYYFRIKPQKNKKKQGLSK